MTLNEIVNLAVQWGPTVLFILIVFGGFLTGVRRGFRKSTILAINALIAFVAVVAAYIYLVTNPLTDEYVVTYGNMILEKLGQNSIQGLLGATESAKSLTDILTEIIPKSMDLGEGVSTVVKDNGVYLATLVNSAYHLVFAIILSIVYLVLVFIFYLFYLIFLPERRYKKKKNKLYVKGVGKPYKKRRLLGGLVGSLRSVVGGLVFLSFFGTLLFIVTGNDGSTESDDVKFGDEQIDQYYDIYEAVGEYGNYGIYSLLNSIKDKDNVPYYLYAADLVLSGSYEDPETNVNASIVYREEFANYVKFARSTVELLMKYGADDITPILKGQEGDLTVALTNTFAKEGFKEEFNTIIDNFEEETFFINFALSAVDSIARNINDFNFIAELDQQTRDILSIVLTGEDAITVSNIVNKEDAKILLNSVITIMAEDKNNTEEKSDALKTISYVKKVLPEITKLSMFTDNTKKAKGNKVLANVYDYVMESLTNNETESVKTPMTTDKIMKLTNKTVTEIDWMGELASLLNVGVDVLNIYENNFNEENPASGLFHMLDADNPNKETNKTSLDNIINSLSKSEILGLALSTSYVNDMLVGALSSLVENVVLPNEVDYVRKLNADGSVKTEGEIYILLKSVELLLENGFGDFYDKMSSEEGFEGQSELITELADMLLKETNDESVIDTLLDSKLLKYTLSQVLTSLELGEFTIVIPESCQEDVPEEIVIINDETLKSLVSNISLLLPEEGSDEMIDIKKILQNKDKILENEILHSSIIMFLVDTFSTEEGEESTISIPAAYKTTKEELSTNYSTNKWIVDSEVSKILNGLDAIFAITTSEEKFDINNINMDSIKINTTNVSVVLQSAILHTTVSDIVVDTLESSEIEIPADAKAGNLIKTTEIVNLVDALACILGVEDIQVNEFNIESISLKSTDIPTLFNSSIIKRKVTVEVNKATDMKFVDQIYETNERKDIKANHAQDLLRSLEILLNAEDGIDFNNIDVADISINTKTIDEALDSVIFLQIVSDNVTKNETIKENIPSEVYTSNYTVNGTLTSIITKAELVSLVNALAVITSDEPLENGIKIDVNNININSVKLKSTDIPTLFESLIIKRKVTVEVNKATDMKFVDQIYETNARLDVKKEEAQALLAALEQITNSPNGIDFNNVDVANVEISSTNVATALNSTIFAQIVSDNIIKNSSIEGNIPASAVDTTTYTVTTGQTSNNVAMVKTSEIKNLIGSIETLFNQPLSAQTSFDINNAEISYGDNGNKGNLMKILESEIIEFLVSDKIIDTLVKVPTTCLSEIDIYNTTTKANVISKTELGKLVQIIGTLNNDVYKISVGGQMDFNGFDRAKTVFLKQSEIAKYKVSEILLTQQDLVIPVQSLEQISVLGSTNVKVLEGLEFGRFIDALNAVIPADKGFNEVAIQMPSNSADYTTVAASDVLRATITSKLKVNGSATYLEGDLDLTNYTDGTDPIAVLNQTQLVNALSAVSALNGNSSSEFATEISIATLATFDEESLNAILSFNMLRYQVSDLMNKIPYLPTYETENIYTYTITATGIKESTSKVDVHTVSGIKAFLATFA